MARDLFCQPRPHPVLYLRCDACHQVAPRTTVRTIGRYDSVTGVVRTPPERPCPLCGSYAPRVVGDEHDPTDPDVTTVTGTYTASLGWLRLWRSCRTTFDAPAVAVLVDCPVCGTRYAVPATEPDVP